MILRDYQEDFLNNILESLKTNNKVCCQLSTGGGKTVVFTELINRLNKKTLILVDSVDLIDQTINTFSKKGLDIGCIKAGNKKIPDNKVIVAMVSTLWNRKEKIPNFDYCIVDECHIFIFNKLFPYLKDCKIIGFTATPVRLKRYKIDYCDVCKSEVESEICPNCNTDSVEASRVETMCDVYDDIVIGKPIKWLIDNNHLVEDVNELFEFDGSGLKTDASGEFTAKSMKEVFQSREYQKALLTAYKRFALGKKTLLFTSSTETNLIFKMLFKDYNVRTYDSVNNTPNERDDIIKWFKSTPDAILINTGVFTKGFDIDDVEVILMARATKSLSLWIQICGRGARTTKKIYKPNFLVIDGGNNNQEHQHFSFDRNWKKLFYDKQIKLKLVDTHECESCGYMFNPADKICPECGEEIEIEIIEREAAAKEYVIKGRKFINEIPTIHMEFMINKGATKFEALKVLKQKWILFLSNLNINKEQWGHHLTQSGQFDEKLRVNLLPEYRKIINSMLKDSQRVIYENYKNKLLTEAYENKYGKN